MRILLITFSGLWILICFSGCRAKVHGLRLASNLKPQPDASKVFPHSMVGRWQAEAGRYGKWVFQFEPDGSISKITHSVAGPIKVSEGGKYVEGPDEGTYAMFVLGTCEAEYDKITKVLKVKVFLDHFTMKLPTGALKGRSEDYFEGTVCTDGKNWKADWRSYGWLDGADPPDVERIDERPEKLLFTKAERDAE